MNDEFTLATAFIALGAKDRAIDDLRARLAATEIKLAAARLALAACREVREARDA